MKKEQTPVYRLRNSILKSFLLSAILWNFFIWSYSLFEVINSPSLPDLNILKMTDVLFVTQKYFWFNSNSKHYFQWNQRLTEMVSSAKYCSQVGNQKQAEYHENQELVKRTKKTLKFLLPVLQNNLNKKNDTISLGGRNLFVWFLFFCEVSGLLQNSKGH